MFLYMFLSVFISFTRSFSTVVAVQQLCANPLNLVSNVDMRSLTGAASGPLAEVGSEDDDEQNCPAASGIGVYLFD